MEGARRGRSSCYGRALPRTSCYTTNGECWLLLFAFALKAKNLFGFLLASENGYEGRPFVKADVT